MMKKKDAIGKNIILENNNIKSNLIKYGISIGIAIGMVLLTLWTHDFYEETELENKYKILSDAFTIPGVTYIMLGLLVALSNEGSLSAIGYMLKRCFKMLIPFSNKDNEKYADYVANRKRVEGYSFLFYTGLLFLIVAIVFIFLFYSVYSA